jgi:hypothetical protein
MDTKTTRPLRLNEIKDLQERPVPNELTRRMMNLGVKIRLEIDAGGAVSIMVVDSDTGKDRMTFDDLQKSFVINRILRDELDTVNADTEIESVFKHYAVQIEKGELTEKKYPLSSNVKAAALRLDRFASSYKLILEDFKPFRENFNGNPLVEDFARLLERYDTVLTESAFELYLPGSRKLEPDILYPKFLKYGIPKWFHEKVIKDRNNFSSVFAGGDVGRLFFASDGVGSISLTTEEVLNKGPFEEVIGNTMSNSCVLFEIVEDISKENKGLQDLGFGLKSEADREIFSTYRWNLFPAHVDADSYLSSKIKGKVCPLVPYGSGSFKSNLDRLHVSMVRSINLETSSVDSLKDLFSAIFGAASYDTIVPGANLFGIAGRVSKFEDLFLGYINQDTKQSREIFVRAFMGQISSFDYGAFNTGMKAYMKKFLGRNFKDADKDKIVDDHMNKFMKVCSLEATKTTEDEMGKDRPEFSENFISEDEESAWKADNDKFECEFKEKFAENTAKLVDAEKLAIEAAVTASGYVLPCNCNKTEKYIKTDSGFTKGGFFTFPENDGSDTAKKRDIEITRLAHGLISGKSVDKEAKVNVSYTLSKEASRILKGSTLSKEFTNEAKLKAVKLIRGFKDEKLQIEVAEIFVGTTTDYFFGKTEEDGNVEENDAEEETF